MKKQRVIGIRRETSFKGKRKIGIDTNIFVKLYQQPFLFDYEQARIFKYSGLIFTHAICRYELIKYIRKDGKTLEDAKKEANSFIKQHNINIIFSKDCFIKEEERISFENFANGEFKKIKPSTLKCHKPDSIILLAFKKKGINKIFSTDRSFREGAKLLGMDGAGLPSLDYVISKNLKRIFDHNHKKSKRKRR